MVIQSDVAMVLSRRLRRALSLGGAFGIGQQVLYYSYSLKTVDPDRQNKAVFQLDVLRDSARRYRLACVRTGRNANLSPPSVEAVPAVPA